MKKPAVLIFAAIVAVIIPTASGQSAEDAPDWSFNATIIEACSCPMFCPCYFNSEPAAHSHGGDTEHYCRFNMAYKVNEGHYGDVDLSGAKFWIAGDLGGHWEESMDWAVLTFDPSVTPEQREGIGTVVGQIYPVEWKSFSIAEDAEVHWEHSGDDAHGKLGDGVAEVVLHRGPALGEGHVVIENLKYWGVPRNDGFVLMPNEVQGYRTGDKAFETKGTNGFMITLDIASSDVE